MKQLARTAWVAALCLGTIRPGSGAEATPATPSSSSIHAATDIVAATANVKAATPADPYILAIQRELDGLRQTAPAEPVTPEEQPGFGNTLTAGMIMQTVGGLLVVVLLLLTCAAVARRVLGPRLGLPSREMRLVSSLSISNKSKIHVLEADGQRFLVGEGAGQLSLIAALGEHSEEGAAETEPVNHTPVPEGFSSRFEAWQQQAGAGRLSSEVRTSLMLIDGLCKRLRGKKSPGPSPVRSDR